MAIGWTYCCSVHQLGTEAEKLTTKIHKIVSKDLQIVDPCPRPEKYPVATLHFLRLNTNPIRHS